MRVATARQMAAIDHETISGGVPGDELMERAGREIVRCLLEMFPGFAPPAKVAVCCGKGNNGGDGLVIARLLDSLGYRVAVMLLSLPEDLTVDAALNLGRLPASVEKHVVPRQEWPTRWCQLSRDADLTVDAVFGTGIQPPVRGPYVPLLEAFNAHLAPVVSVDIPSGVCGDTGRVAPVAVAADATVTVGLPKLGLILPPGRDHVGDLAVVDIGFSEDVIARATEDHNWFQPDVYAALLPPRSSDAHKYRCGTVLVVAGSCVYGGAAVLAGLGALRSGAGLVTVAVPSPLELPTRVALPEALVAPLPVTERGTLSPLIVDRWNSLLERQHALAIGPGLGDDPRTDRAIVSLLGAVELPLVVDADALSAFGRLGCEPAFASSQVVLTPHAGELARLVGIKPAEVERRRLELACELAVKWGVTMLLKGSPAVIADPSGSLTFNPVGDDALAHGGTGDVLTGLVGGLLAQGSPAPEAALLGAYLHGRAGRLASLDVSRRGVMAREVADRLGEAWLELEGLPQARAVD